jgi:hypothetical protein
MRSQPHTFTSAFGIKSTLVAWFGMLGFDLFLHAGLLADVYTKETPFLLPPLEAWNRIPIGYMSFLINAAFLTWFILKLDVRGWKRGAGVGLGLGAVMWFSLGLGLYSITTAAPSLLTAWAVGQSVEMAYAGALLGWSNETDDLRKAFFAALLGTMIFVALVITLQSMGLVETTRVQAAAAIRSLPPM